MRWTCPSCDREFGRAHASHVCVPGISVDDVFAGKPSYMREVYNEVVTHLRSSGPVHEDAVRVGVFLKAERKVCEVRPLVRLVKLHLMLPRPVEGAVQVSARTWWLQRSLTCAPVPPDVLALLDEAYDGAS